FPILQGPGLPVHPEFYCLVAPALLIPVGTTRGYNDQIPTLSKKGIVCSAQRLFLFFIIH
ncbi:MAG TPA: hypothetical protein VKY33_03080, partial [Flavobacterium sp.]|nr:hypothetical protein [Flavobacterium sp.]